jgi:hypothetical protein
MSQTTDTRLTNIDQGLTEVRGGVALLADEMRLHGEALTRILEILTPAETEQSGPPLHELLAQLISRLDRQSVMLKDILAAQGNLARNLPLDVARVIDDNYGAGGPPPAGAAGNGHATGGASQP